VPYVLAASGPGGLPAVLRDLAAPASLVRRPPGADVAVAGCLDGPAAVVDAVLATLRHPGWRVGVGAGPGDAAGAHRAARRALDAALQRAARLAVRGADPTAAADAQAVLSALAALGARRSPAAWEVIALVARGHTQARAAAELGISRQAVGQRLAAGLWEVERDLRPAAAHLLRRAAAPPLSA
jgi:hypothetical protein